MLTVGGYTPAQLAIFGAVGVVLAAHVGWRVWPHMRAAVVVAGRKLKRDDPQPAILPKLVETWTSDDPAPPGTLEWIGAVLSAVSGAPDELKLSILLDPDTTVASAQAAYIEYLRGSVAPIPNPDAKPEAAAK
jgi:hypothetical protein